MTPSKPTADGRYYIEDLNPGTKIRSVVGTKATVMEQDWKGRRTKIQYEDGEEDWNVHGSKFWVETT